MLSPGQTIDRYTVDSVIGHGGTAVVYLVRHNQLGSQHALKVLSLSSGAIRKRLLREGRVQAALQHTNIVSVTDVLDVGGNPGLLMEHIDGPALDQAMRRYKIGLRDALILFRGIVAGVRAAHREGLVHRDLKPANVLLFRSPEGFVPKVTDFGLAKVVVGRGSELGQTRQGIAMGTPAYMAPEQIHDARAVDQRADIFSLGCLLYELTTRSRAFPGDQALEIYNNIVGGRYTPPEEINPDLPDAIIQAIDGCLITDRERRIPDCDTLLKVLGGRQTWEIVPHPIPDEVLPTEEVPRDAPDMPIATGNTIPQGGTPAPAPPRGAGTASVSGQPSTSVSSATPVDVSDTFDPDVVDGTLGGDIGSRRRGAWLVPVLLVAAVLVLVVGLGGILLTVGVGAAVVSVPGTEGPPLAIDGASGAAGPGPTPAEPIPIEGGTEAGGVVVDPVPDADVDPDSDSPPDTAAVVTPVSDDIPQPGSAEAIPEPPPRPTPVATTGVVRISSVPLTVELMVDGQDHGRTPKKLDLEPGAHLVKVRSDGRTAEFPIFVKAGEDARWCYSFPDKASSRGRCSQ